MGTYGKYTGTVGCQPTGPGGVFQGGGAGGRPIRVGDVGTDPPHGQVPADISAQSRQADYGETSKATGGWEIGLPNAGDSDGGGRV